MNVIQKNHETNMDRLKKKKVDFLDFPGRKGGSRVQGGEGCCASLKITGSSAFTGLSSYCSLRVGIKMNTFK